MPIFNKKRYLCRAQLMSMYGMLDCAKNFKAKYKGNLCTVCNVLDDESHRINFCKKYKDTNLFNSTVKIDFEFIHSGNEEVVKNILEVVCEIWDLDNKKNCMRLS